MSSSDDQKAKRDLKAITGGKIIAAIMFPGIPQRFVLLLDFPGEEIIPGVQEGGTRKELVVEAPIDMAWSLNEPRIIKMQQPKSDPTLGDGSEWAE